MGRQSFETLTLIGIDPGLLSKTDPPPESGRMWRVAVAAVVSVTVEIEPGWFGGVANHALEDLQPAFQSDAIDLL